MRSGYGYFLPILLLMVFLSTPVSAQEIEPRGEEGFVNTLYGDRAGMSLTGDGVFNTMVGNVSGLVSTDASYNTFLGSISGRYNTIGFNNTFLGAYAGHDNITGYNNTFVGLNAGLKNRNAWNNTFVGSATGQDNVTGTQNTYLGASAGNGNRDGSNNVFIGYMAGHEETGSNRLHIHSSERGLPLIYGEFDNRIVRINGDLETDTTRSSSDLRLKKEIRPLRSSLDKVGGLRGVSYLWRTEDFPERGFKETRQIGLVAQEVEEVLPELVSTNGRGFKSVSYDKLTAVLVEAVKELRYENRRLRERLQRKTQSQQNQIDQLRRMLEELQG